MKNIWTKHILKKNGLSTHKCINQINGSGCRGLNEGRRGAGLVLNEGDKCYYCQFNGSPWLRLDVEPSSDSPQLLSPARSPLSTRHRRSQSLPGSPVCESPGSYTSILEEYTKESEVDPYMFMGSNDLDSLKNQGVILNKEEEGGDENLPPNSNEEGEILIKFKRESNNPSFAFPISRSDSGTSTLEEGKKTEVLKENIGLRVVEEFKARPFTNSSWDLISSPRTPAIGTPVGRGERFKVELVGVLKEYTRQVINLKEESELDIVRGRLEHLLVENQKLRDENKLLKKQVRELNEYKLFSEESTLQRLVARRSVDEDKVQNLCKAYEIYESWSKNGRGDLGEAERKIEDAKRILRNPTRGSLEKPVDLEDAQGIYRTCQEIAKLRIEVKKQQERYVAKIEIPARSSSRD